MANLCTNNVILKGNEEILLKLKEAIVSVGTRNKIITPEAIADELGVTINSSGRSYDTAMGTLEDINFDTIENRYLQFYVCSAWGDMDDFWKILCDELELDGFACMSEADGEYWCANDPDGLWFPENYVFDSYGDGPFEELETSFFTSKQELEDSLNKISEEKHSFEEWKEIINSDSEFGQIAVVERTGEQLPREEGKLSHELDAI